jgi:hypothetical protein
VTDSNQAVLAAQEAVQGLVDVLGERDAALADASVQAKLASDALADMRAQNDAIKQANIALQAQLDTAAATIASLKALNVVTAKADATGATVSNAGIQAAIDVAQPGQTVKVPAGKYLIDPAKPIAIKSGVSYDLAGAVFQVKPSALSRCYVLYADGATDFTITGGEIVGDRLAHDYSGPTTEEWCHGGAFYRVQRASIVGLKVSQMPGDGLSINGSDILLDGVVSIQNRRQGLSIAGGASNRIKIRNCDFSDTGAFNGQAGTAPMAGIDIEPDTGNVDDVEITDSRMAGNDSSGLLLWTRSNTPTMLSVTNVRAIRCDMRGNPNGINAKSASGKPMDLAVSQCTLSKNTGSNIRVDANATVKVDGCTFEAVKDRADFTLAGTDFRTANDIRVLTGGKAVVGTNSYK